MFMVCLSGPERSARIRAALRAGSFGRAVAMLQVGSLGLTAVSFVSSVLLAAMLLAPWISQHYFENEGLTIPLQLYLVQGFWAVVPGWVVIALQASRRMGQLVTLENASSLATAILPVAFVL